MNIAHLLTPKVLVAYLYDDCSVRQGLEKMKYHGYTSIPVISRDGVYQGAISEGDFLWYLLDTQGQLRDQGLKDLEDLSIVNVPRRDRNHPVQISASLEDLLALSVNQNFVPVIDDRNTFIGIVTRRQIMQYYADGTIQPPASTKSHTPDPEIYTQSTIDAQPPKRVS